MKKILSLIIVLTLVFTMLTSCSLMDILGGNPGNEYNYGQYAYTAFTASEKALFIEREGVVPLFLQADFLSVIL